MVVVVHHEPLRAGELSAAVGRIGNVDPARLLAFEERNRSWRGNKETRIREEFDLSPARYVALLERAAASLEGMQADPLGARRVLDFAPPRIRWGA